MSPEPDDQPFSRIERIIGADGLATLRVSHAVIIGLGAVGGYAMEALCRSGIGTLRVVDFDRVQPTNLNRQLLATHETLGRPKVQVAGERIRAINPDCRVEAMELFAHVESFDAIFDGRVDIVIDAIDAVTPKAAVIDACHQRRLPLISAMGAAMRMDPTAVRIERLSKTSGCPLARQIRRKLKRMASKADPLCVYSNEPLGHLPDSAVADDADSPTDLYERGRKRRVLGSLPTVTGIFGLCAAQAALDILLGNRPWH